nr:MAG TPA: hypothetical protein [Caudoviricetes sp.]
MPIIAKNGVIAAHLHASTNVRNTAALSAAMQMQIFFILPFSFLLLVEPISNQSMANIVHLDFACAAFQFCLYAFRNRNHKIFEQFQFLFVIGFHYVKLLSLDVCKAHNNTHELVLVGIGYRFRLSEHPNSVLRFVSPSHKGQELGHFACGYALELSLDGQRIDRALDATDALSILKTNKENELDLSFPCIILLIGQGRLAPEVLDQIISLGEDDGLMIVRLFVCLDQSQSIITHMTPTGSFIEIRALRAGFYSSTTHR